MDANSLALVSVVPAVIVGISMGVTQLEGYGHEFRYYHSLILQARAAQSNNWPWFLFVHVLSIND